jgi:hypothetical protein
METDMRYYLAKSKSYEDTSDIGWRISEGIVFFWSFDEMLEAFYNGDDTYWAAVNVKHHVFIPEELT